MQFKLETTSQPNLYNTYSGDKWNGYIFFSPETGKYTNGSAFSTDWVQVAKDNQKHMISWEASK